MSYESLQAEWVLFKGHKGWNRMFAFLKKHLGA